MGTRMRIRTCSVHVDVAQRHLHAHSVLCCQTRAHIPIPHLNNASNYNSSDAARNHCSYGKA